MPQRDSTAYGSRVRGDDDEEGIRAFSGKAKAGVYQTLATDRKTKVRKETMGFWETRHERECSRGADQTGLSQDRMAGARYRRGTPVRRRRLYAERPGEDVIVLQ